MQSPAATSASFPNGIGPLRSEAEARAARRSMFDVIQAGADAAVKADPKPLSQTMQAIEAAGARMKPFPLGAPLPDQITGEYHAKPCSAPRARISPAGVGNPCICGFEMGEHRNV